MAGGMLGNIGQFAGPAMAIGQGVVNSQLNNEAQRRNKAKLFELQSLEMKDQLGLAPDERRLLDQQLNVPVQQAAQSAQQRADRIAATAGDGASGADLARLRGEAATMRAAGGQEAALAISEANAAKELAQLNEIEQRIGLKAAMKRDDWDGIFNAASQAASASGTAMGAPPSTEGLMGSGGGGAAAELPSSTGIPDAGAADSAGDAASAVADMGGAFARTGGESRPTQAAGELEKRPATFTAAEEKQLGDLANSDPRMFAQMFLASVNKKKAATGGTGG